MENFKLHGMVKKILVSCLSDPSSDPRPNRIINFLISEGFQVDILSYDTVLKGNRNFLIIKNQYFLFIKALIFLMHKLIKFFSKIKLINKLNNKRFGFDTIDSNIKNSQYHYIIAHDLYLLPYLFDNFKNQKIIFDAREYYPKEFESNFIFNYLERPERELICKIYLPKCFKILTVSDKISEEYKTNFNVESLVVLSLPYLKSLPPIAKRENDEIKIVHHGMANPDRKIENMISVVEKIGKNFSLDLVLVGNNKYTEKLKKISKSSKIRFLKPWPFNEIIANLSNYDVGFFYVEPTTFNLKYCLPNKFFEFIHAGLAIAIGPSPEMQKIVEKYNIGIVSDEFSIESMSTALENLNQYNLELFKNNSVSLRNKMNAQVELKKILQILN